MRLNAGTGCGNSTILAPARSGANYERVTGVSCHTLVKTVQMSWELFVNDYVVIAFRQAGAKYGRFCYENMTRV
jgi:hypothetical protein